MHLNVIFRVLGILLMIYSLTMLPPAVVALIYNDGTEKPFFAAFAIILMCGMVFWLPVYNKHQDLRTKDGFLIVVLFWTVLGLAGSIPFLLAKAPHMEFTDAVFESLSGLTTTGATVITGLDDLPKSILFYRQQLQWLGGMGIIVLALAILPILGIGGMQLYRAETPGPVKDSKLTPRITETAKTLWLIYVTLTAVCALSYWLAGMSAFDAIAHSFSTIAIGGFSTHDASIGYFDNPLIEVLTVFFMLIAATNFSLHFYAWRSRSVKGYFADPEFRFFISMLGMICGVTILALYLTETYGSFGEAFRYGFFEAISVATTTGYGTADFSTWPLLLPNLLIMGSFIGGCAASTGGGMKAIRVCLMFKQGLREIKQLIHPQAVIMVKLGNKAVSERVLQAVWGFFGVYLMSFLVIFLSILATGLDFITGFSAVAACFNNLGPGLGDVAQHYADLNNPAKWILCFAMLLGRLEIFTLLVLMSPLFWRR